MPVVMDQEFFADALGADYKTFGAIWSEADNFTNDPVAVNFDWREVAVRI